METVSIINTTVSLHVIGPLEVGGVSYTLLPGIPTDVPLDFLEKFDGSIVLAEKFKQGDLKFLNENEQADALAEAKTLTEILTAAKATIKGGAGETPAP